MIDLEWTALELTLQERARNTRAEDLPMLQRQANGGSVVAQTAIGMVSRESCDLDTSVQSFQKAADASFPIAQLENGEMSRNGRGVLRTACSRVVGSNLQPRPITPGPSCSC